MIYFGKFSYLRENKNPRNLLYVCYKKFFGIDEPHSQIRCRSIWPMIENVTRQSKPASNRHLKTGHLRFNNNLLLRTLLVINNIKAPTLALM
jgi:hypothetical protein